MSRRVAIISYYYPPNRTIGALRVAKFAKYLPEWNWQPLVITVTPGSEMYLRAGTLDDELTQGEILRTRDGSLHAFVMRLRPSLGQTDQGAGAPTARSGTAGRLTRAAYAVYRQVLCFPDECWPWLASYRTIERAVAREKPDVLLSSSPPATAHLLAARLARRLDLPWVADFRDPWSQAHTSRRPFPLDRIERQLERRTIARAAALTTVSQPIGEALQALHGKPCFVVMNGHDGEHTGSPCTPAALPHAARFTLVHTGLLYPVTRDPAPVFAAMRELLEEGAIRQGDFVLRFLGRNLGLAREALAAYPAVAPLVEFGGEVVRQEALEQQCRASALLLLEWPDPRARGVLTGKLFEYLAAGRPVLAIAPKDGEIHRVLAETGGGEVVTSGPEVAAVLRQWVRTHKATGSAAPGARADSLVRYSRREQTRLLAGVLDGVVRA